MSFEDGKATDHAGSRPGWVYCLENESIPGKVKIGFTTQSVEERVAQLDSTGVPTPFNIAAKWLSADASGDERAIHQKLGKHRTRSNREFFDLSAEQAVEQISELIGASPGERSARVASSDIKQDGFRHPTLPSDRFTRIGFVVFLCSVLFSVGSIVVLSFILSGVE